MGMDKKCTIVDEQVTEPVCVTIMDKLVDEVGYILKFWHIIFNLTTKIGCDI